MITVALTGATGFIGRVLLRHLVAQGFQVKALYRPAPNSSPTPTNSVQWQAGDLADQESPRTFVAGADAVVHCAGAVRGSAPDLDMNGFRLRQAYVKLNWKTTELMVGQFWHPMFIVESFPDVVSINTGAPFQPSNRSPQVRYTMMLGKVSLAATALAQRDFVSNGPEGTSSVYLRNAALPEFNLKLQFVSKNEARKTETVAGLGADFMKLAPRIVTAAGYDTDESVSGLSAMAFFKQRWPRWTWKAEAVLGQNLHHMTMLGGYVYPSRPFRRHDYPRELRAHHQGPA